MYSMITHDIREKFQINIILSIIFLNTKHITACVINNIAEHYCFPLSLTWKESLMSTLLETNKCQLLIYKFYCTFYFPQC